MLYCGFSFPVGQAVFFCSLKEAEVGRLTGKFNYLFGCEYKLMQFRNLVVTRHTFFFRGWSSHETLSYPFQRLDYPFDLRMNNITKTTFSAIPIVFKTTGMERTSISA